MIFSMSFCVQKMQYVLAKNAGKMAKCAISHTVDTYEMR